MRGTMSGRTATLIAAALAAVSIVAGCAAGARQPPQPAGAGEAPLTPQGAKEALLAMMRSEPGQQLGWFRGDVPEQMAAMEVCKDDAGWYAWTGAILFNPSRRVYTLTVRPKPASAACTFEYTGSFALTDGRWSATPPKLVSIATPAGP
jgi:hypothetical protein